MTRSRLLALTAATATLGALLAPTSALAAPEAGTSVTFLEARVQTYVGDQGYFLRVRDFGDRTTVDGFHDTFSSSASVSRFLGPEKFAMRTLPGSLLTVEGKKLDAGRVSFTAPLRTVTNVYGSTELDSDVTQDRTVTGTWTASGKPVKRSEKFGNSDGSCLYEESYAVPQDVTVDALEQSFTRAGVGTLAEVTRTTAPC